MSVILRVITTLTLLPSSFATAAPGINGHSISNFVDAPNFRCRADCCRGGAAAVKAQAREGQIDAGGHLLYRLPPPIQTRARLTLERLELFDRGLDGGMATMCVHAAVQTAVATEHHSAVSGQRPWPCPRLDGDRETRACEKSFYETRYALVPGAGTVTGTGTGTGAGAGTGTGSGPYRYRYRRRYRSLRFPVPHRARCRCLSVPAGDNCTRKAGRT